MDATDAAMDAASQKAASASDHAAIAERVRGARTSFYWGMRSLPPARRRAIYAVYAFCRDVDDIADSRRSTAERLRLLEDWRREINALYDGAPSRAISRALAEGVRSYQLRRRDFLSVIDGMEMDAREIMRAPGEDELNLYCSRVAGAVGLLCSRVFGETSPHGERHALALGRAFQLTNILRDLDEDAARGRLYLPREALFACDVWDTDPQAVLASRELACVCDRLAASAFDAFQQADAAWRLCDRRALKPARLMRDVYYALLRRLVASGWRRGAEVRLSRPFLAALLLRHFLIPARWRS